MNGKQVQAIRRKLEFTQQELATAVGKTSRTIIAWEKNGVPKGKDRRVLRLLLASN